MTASDLVVGDTYVCKYAQGEYQRQIAHIDELHVCYDWWVQGRRKQGWGYESVSDFLHWASLAEKQEPAAHHPSVFELERQETAVSPSVASAVEASVGEVEGFDAWVNSNASFPPESYTEFEMDFARESYTAALRTRPDVKAIQRESEVEGMKKTLEAVRGESAKRSHLSRSLKDGYMRGLESAEYAILDKIEEAS